MEQPQDQHLAADVGLLVGLPLGLHHVLFRSRRLHAMPSHPGTPPQTRRIITTIRMLVQPLAGKRFSPGHAEYDWVGRALWWFARFIVRLIRVILVTAVWLAIVFGPVAACLYFDYPFADPPPWALESARPVSYANQATSYQARPTFHFGEWLIAAATWAALA